MTQTTHPAPKKIRPEPFRYDLAVVEYKPSGGWYAGEHTHTWDRKKKKWVKL